MKKAIVTFDFDNTLSRQSVQQYALELMSREVDVWVLTSRYDELHKHRYEPNPTNDDLWEVVEGLGIPRWRVRFTCREPKANYLKGTEVACHIEDDTNEFMEARKIKSNVPMIFVDSFDWKDQCEFYITNKSKKHEDSID
jgi:hypothetical protein